MSYLHDALQHLGLYSTPAHVLALGTASGKGKAPAAYIISNPPFLGAAMIEISRGDNRFQYRICPSDPLLIERKANTPGSRWCFYLRALGAPDTPRPGGTRTKRALLEVGKDEGEGK